jgi:hypothetical protein
MTILNSISRFLRKVIHRPMVAIRRKKIRPREIHHRMAAVAIHRPMAAPDRANYESNMAQDSYRNLRHALSLMMNLTRAE